MYITATDALHRHHRSVTTLAMVALGVIVTMGVVFTTQELRGGTSLGPKSASPTAEDALLAGTNEAPSLLEGDPQAFDHAVAAASALRSSPGPNAVPLRTGTQTAPSLMEGDHGLFEAAVADEIMKLTSTHRAQG